VPQRTPLREASATLAINAGRLRVPILADTHGAPHPNTTRLLAGLHPDAILHAGDIGPSVLDELEKVAPLHAVRGNIDPRDSALPDFLFVDLLNGATCVFRLLVTHIALVGVRLRAETAKLARERGARMVVCGHSHVPFLGQDRGLVVFNPGSAGPRRTGLPVLFGVLELGPAGLELHHIDCETGARWKP